MSAGRRVGIIPVSPFRSEPVVRALDKDLRIKTLFSRCIGGINGGAYRVPLRSVRAVVLPVQFDLPLAFVKPDDVLRSRHFPAPMNES